MTSARTKIARRLLPFLFLVYVTAYIDRVNVGFAGLDMTRELHFSGEVFGFGSGVLFFGLCLLQIPGGILAEKWSARRWIATVMIVWGVLAALTGRIQTATQFNAIRFLVGLAEGGFFPAVVVYLTHWFRQEDRAKAVALFMSAIPVSNVLGGVVAGKLLTLNWLHMAGWRWLLILEGAPAIVGGIAAFFYLTDWPRDATWLTQPERAWIGAELKRESLDKASAAGSSGLFSALRNPMVLAFTASYFCLNIANYGLTFWLPKIVQKFAGLTTWQIGLVASIPFLSSIPAMYLASWHSDKTGERKWHALAATLATASGLAFSQIPGISPAFAIAGFSLAAMGVMSYYPCFWALPTKLLSAEAAGAYGFITFGNLGGFAGPYAIGFLTDLTGTYAAGILFMVGAALLSGLIVACLPAGQAGNGRYSEVKCLENQSFSKP